MIVKHELQHKNIIVIRTTLLGAKPTYISPSQFEK